VDLGFGGLRDVLMDAHLADIERGFRVLESDIESRRFTTACLTAIGRTPSTASCACA
jgi:hypothetical protein